MFTIVPVIQSKIDLSALAGHVDLSEVDKLSSKPLDKLSMLASSIFRLNVAHDLISLTFYFNLPFNGYDLLANTSPLKVHGAVTQGVIVQGFISGSLAEYQDFVKRYCHENIDSKLRFMANFFFNYLRTEFQMMKDTELKQLSDKTFVVRG